MNIQQIPSEDWADFKANTLRSLFGETVPARGRYWFRGQGSAGWPLLSSFDRWYRSIDHEEVSKRQSAERFIELFREEASRMTPEPIGASSPEEVLALAQHYGVPTRLLDWTETPYVAAFFAFSSLVASPDTGDHVAIWCLDTESRMLKEDTGIKLLNARSPYNERLKNQLGKFTLLRSPFDTVEEHVQQCCRTGTTLRKIAIPASEARRALSDLDFMGINYSTIFPGLEGTALAAKLRGMLECLPCWVRRSKSESGGS